MKQAWQFFGFVLIIAVLLLVAPLLCIWALNTISEQSGIGWYVPHNFWTYLAVFVLCAAFGRSK